MDDTIENAIVANATRPSEVTTDAGTLKTHPLPDQIAADKYIAAKAAAKTPSRGIRFTRLVPEGTA